MNASGAPGLRLSALVVAARRKEDKGAVCLTWLC